MGREDQFGPAVSGVGAAFEIAQPCRSLTSSEVVQAQLGPGGKVGEAHTVDPDIAEDVQVRLPQVGVSLLDRGREQLGAELPQQPAQQLADGLPIGR